MPRNTDELKRQPDKVKCPHCKHVFECDGTDKTGEVMLHIANEHPKVFLKAWSSLAQ